MSKRIISVLLMLVMLAGLLPVSAQAQDSQPAVDGGEMTIEGTNGFGQLLSEDITQEQQAIESRPQSGYTLTDLEITGSTATVTYNTMEAATLVVALYTEDGAQLLTSGKTTVLPEQTQATVTIEGKMPQYFLATAYLLDSYDLSPLCPGYDTPMYTKAMQELLASTVEDYEADRVLQLDSSTQTNFAVYAPTTKVIEPKEGVNLVAQADAASGTYVIEHADEQITSLNIGDVLAYAYSSEEILIIKVAAISISGTTVTITGGELEMEEAFSHVKLESLGQTQDMEVDDSTASQGVTFQGMTGGAAPRSAEGSSGIKPKAEFTIDEWEKKGESDSFDYAFSIKASLLVELDIEFNYYVSADKQYLEMTTEFNLGGSFEMEGSFANKIPLGKLSFMPVPGVSLGFEPALELRFSGKLEVFLGLNQTVGFRYENGKEPEDLSTSPKITAKLDLEATIFFGIDLHPTAAVLGSVIKLELTALAGAEIKASMSNESTSLDDKERHECKNCIAMDVSLKLELGVKLEFLKCDFLSISADLLKLTEPIGSMYYSFDLDRFDFGTCPNMTYRVTVEVLEEDGDFVPDTSVRDGSGKELGKTNANGVLVLFLESGSHTLEADVWSDRAEKSFHVSSACSVKLSTNPKLSAVTVFDTTDTGALLDRGTLVNSGTHGNLRWEYYNGGVVYILGEGEMYTSYTYPWDYCGKWATHVVVGEGVTSIAANAFDNFAGAKHFSLPSTLTRIEDGAFASTSQLTGITIPEGVTSIGAKAFYMAKKLTQIRIPDSVETIGSQAFDTCSALQLVELGSGVKEIGASAFRQDTALQAIRVSGDNPYFMSDDRGVLYNKNQTRLIQAPGGLTGSYTLPDTVDTVGAYAFYYCKQVTEIILPEGVTELEDAAFHSCSALTHISIPNSIQTIGSNVFGSCSKLSYTLHDNGQYLGNPNHPYLILAKAVKTNIKSCLIHEDTRFIGPTAFSGCYQLGDVFIPYQVEVIGDSAFDGCFALKNMVIPMNVKVIGNSAFYNCWTMTSIDLGSGLESIGDSAFYGASKLEQITIPNSVRYIGKDAFRDCSALTSYTLGTGISQIPQGMFRNTGLTELQFPSWITGIGDEAFYSCNALTAVTIPDHITHLGSSAFYDCNALTTVTIGNGVTAVGDSAFNSCNELTEVTIGNGVTSIGYRSFYQCEKLAAVHLGIGIQTVGEMSFKFCSALTDVYYAGTQADWDEIEFADYYLRSVRNIHFSDASTASSMIEVVMEPSQLIQYNSVFPGESGSETVDSVTYKTSTFKDLVPGAEYVLLNVVTMDTQDLLAGDNLLFVGHGVAGEDGTLSFRYLQKVTTKLSYVMVCGASNKNLADAQITFPEMQATEDIQVPKPQVVYEGTVLTEGLDYVLLGDVDFLEAGVYTCYIRGIHNYTGLVECPYTVRGAGVTLSGSVTSYAQGDTTLTLLLDGTETATTVVTGATGSYTFTDIPAGSYTLRVSKENHATRDYPITLEAQDLTQDAVIYLMGDADGNGKVNIGDVVKLNAHSRAVAPITDEYLLQCANVNGGKLNIGDVAVLYAHVRGKKPLY